MITVVIDKRTSRHVMSQSDGDADVMFLNAVSAGIPEQYIEIREMSTDELTLFLVKQPKSTEENNAVILDEIQKLEVKQARALREAIMNGDKTRLESIDAKIASLREQLK